MGGLIAEDGSPIDLQLKRGGVYGKIQDPAVRISLLFGVLGQSGWVPVSLA